MAIDAEQIQYAGIERIIPWASGLQANGGKLTQGQARPLTLDMAGDILDSGCMRGAVPAAGSVPLKTIVLIPRGHLKITAKIVAV